MGLAVAVQAACPPHGEFGWPDTFPLTHNALATQCGFVGEPRWALEWKIGVLGSVPAPADCWHHGNPADKANRGLCVRRTVFSSPAAECQTAEDGLTGLRGASETMREATACPLGRVALKAAFPADPGALQGFDKNS